MLASLWLFSFSGYSQNFNTVVHISKPSGVRLAPKQSAIKQDSVIQPINNTKGDTISHLSERNIHLLAIMPLRDISKLIKYDLASALRWRQALFLSLFRVYYFAFS